MYCMIKEGSNGVLVKILGSGKGSGAAMVMLVLGITGGAICLTFWENFAKVQIRGTGGIMRKSILG